MSLDKTPQSPSGTKGWMVTYTQSDVDTIREQIEQREADKRRLLFLTLVVVAAALAGAIILLTVLGSLYSGARSAHTRLSQDYAALKKQSDQCAAELSSIKAREEGDARTRAEAQAKFENLLPAAASAILQRWPKWSTTCRITKFRSPRSRRTVSSITGEFATAAPQAPIRWLAASSTGSGSYIPI